MFDKLLEFLLTSLTQIKGFLPVAIEQHVQWYLWIYGLYSVTGLCLIGFGIGVILAALKVWSNKGCEGEICAFGGGVVALVGCIMFFTNIYDASMAYFAPYTVVLHELSRLW